MGDCCWQGGPGSQAQVLISTLPGASNSDVQSVVGTLATAASSGQLLYDLKATGACTCLLKCCICAHPTALQLQYQLLAFDCH